MATELGSVSSARHGAQGGELCAHTGLMYSGIASVSILYRAVWLHLQQIIQVTVRNVRASTTIADEPRFVAMIIEKENENNIHRGWDCLFERGKRTTR